MKLVQSILTKNPCYTAGRKITVKGLMLHSVGCPQPKASVFIKNWNSPSYDSACVHGFIDGNDGTVYQTLPWNHRGWHCGSGSRGSGNNTHIGVEMCEPACIRYTSGSNFTCSDKATARAVAKRTYEAAVELFAMLCKQYNLNPTADGVIVSHREGHGRGIASNHGDPEHLWNGLGMGYTMDGFRKAVKAKMSGGTVDTDSPGLQASSLKNLSEADVSLVPKSIEDSGRTLTLADVQWQEAGGFYNAAATYTGTASSKYATGYTVTADYAGEVTKTTSGTVLYTAVFGLAEEQEAVTAIPQPAAEGGGFDWRWLLVLPAGAGVVGLVFLGRFLLQKYKSKKEWKEYNK